MRKPIIVKASISDTVEILGHKVDGYKAILKAVEYASSPGSTMINGRSKEIIICAITTDSLHSLTEFLRSSGQVVPPLGAGRSPTDEFKSVKQPAIYFDCSLLIE